MAGDFTSTQPIYLQLVRRLCKQIVRGEIAVGDKLPSLREMAIQVGVNPNTVQRVYAELERIAVVETRRGQGTFVTGDHSRLRQLREELMENSVTAFLSDMREMGFAVDEILRSFKEHQASD